MTARLIFEATLIELSKHQAPSLKLYEFNYLFNKAINQYINKVYNVYDINQQTTDDLRVLKATAFLTPKKVKLGSNYNSPTYNGKMANNQGGEAIDAKSVNETTLSHTHSSIKSLHGATYEIEMPLDYLHMLNCVCIYYVAKLKDCWDAGSYIEVPALRLTADSWSQIVTDIYNRPSPMRPYYYIHNLNQANELPTNDVATGGTDFAGGYNVTAYNLNAGSNFSRTFKLGEKDMSVVEKPIASRVGNASTVRCEIRYGKNLNKNQVF